MIATDPIHKATIIPRGRALGMVLQLPESDKLSMSLEQMTSRLAIMMAAAWRKSWCSAARRSPRAPPPTSSRPHGSRA